MNQLRGINIYSKSTDWLGKALTNPSYAKSDKSDYDFIPSIENPLTINWIQPENFKLPYNRLFKWAINKYGSEANAKNAWGYSVESWYFANTWNFNYEQFQKEIIMYSLTREKLKKFPKLVEEINIRGGLEFLENCSHIVSGNKNWEGKGYESNFIKILIFSFKNVTTGQDSTKIIMNSQIGLFSINSTQVQQHHT